MTLSSETIFFIGFSIFVAFVMALDLGAFSKSKSHVVSFKEAGIWSAVWVTLALGFFVFIRQYGYLIHDISNIAHLQEVKERYYESLKLPPNFEVALRAFQNSMAIDYLTGYLTEYSLSIDNIFVFILIFNSFGVNKRYYKKVLVWGILGSVVLRFVFIFVGAALIQEFDWILYIFGAFLIYTGVKILWDNGEEEQIDPAHHPIVKFASKYLNVYKRNVTDHFLVFNHRYKKWYITPLFLVMLVIAGTDVVFAVDSIPAIFSITKDPYIVFFSNVFAIMGLRSMFFFLASIMGLFRFLKYGLGVLLSFIGVKMLLHHQLMALGFTNVHSLIVIVGILAVSVGASVLFPVKKQAD
ncbi:TerC/Alx family metal homeostasis membrane protein [Emticicia sp. 17c]|uniref:TerC/Alx family metal homeostasis membrane protein n=1 Tax=Emticicia sp. 17c TaxID=3127704 RepID=UPI00301C7842